MTFWLLCLAGWLAGALLTHGLAFAHMQRCRPLFAESDYRHHLALSLGLALLGGPLGVLPALGATGARHGLKFW